MLSKRERDVCVRLLAFREILQISRAKFAASIGIGSERLASYEAARAPLRYEIFRAIAEKYELNPTWLATGNQSPKLERAVDYSAFENEITRRTLFTEAYDKVLASRLEKLSEEAEHWSEQTKSNLSSVLKILQEEPRLVPIDRLQSVLQALEMLLKKMNEETVLRTSAKVAILAHERKMKLTETETSATLSPTMDSQLDTLLARLRAVTQEPGAKTELATFLNVPLASVSRWLSGEREPGGETTLRLLKWVEAKEQSAKEKNPWKC